MSKYTKDRIPYLIGSVALLFVLILLIGFAATAYAGYSGSSGSRSGGGSSGGSKSNSPSNGSRSSGGGSSKPSVGGKSYTPTKPNPARPSSGPKANPPATRLIPPPRPPARPGGFSRPPAGLAVPRGRNFYRDGAFLRSSAGSRYLDPYNRSYYGYANSPFHYWYLFALFHNSNCDSHNQDDDPDCPKSVQHVSYGSDGGCNSIALLPLGLFGFGPTGAMWMVSRRRRRDLSEEISR